MIEIHSGAKAYWLGALFFMMILESCLKVIAGIVHMESSRYYTTGTAIEGIIMLIITLGWWFAE